MSQENLNKALGEVIPLVVEGATRLAADQLQTDIMKRIFEIGSDANGKVIKNGIGYTDAYAKYRRAVGRQVTKIDLQLTGDLMRSITRVDTTQGVNVIFNNDFEAEKARYLEKNLGRFVGGGSQQIFFPSDIEADKALDLIEQTFIKTLDELVARYS